MYPMPEFQERDPARIREFILRHPLGMVTAMGERGIVATHIPLLLDADETTVKLRGHVMRKTSHWEGFKHSSDVLVAFTGPNAPVLESWVVERPFGGTWNYMAVHVRGTLRFLPEEELLEILMRLKDLHEDNPSTKFSELPKDYVPSLINAIEGFEIVADSVEAVFKLSQNRTPEDFEKIIEKLSNKSGESALVAQEMIARRTDYFPR